MGYLCDPSIIKNDQCKHPLEVLAGSDMKGISM